MMSKAKKTKYIKDVKKVGSKKSSELLELKDQLTRALADYDNLVKRAERERATFSQFASLGIISRLLPVIDNIKEAQKHLEDPGLSVALSQITEILKDEGVSEVIAQKGDDFEEDLFEAVDAYETDDKKLQGKVAEMIMPGWEHSSGKVIRHAKVKVYKKTSLKNV